MAREQRSESLDSIVTDDSEDPLTCPLTQRLFHDPVILVASGVTYILHHRHGLADIVERGAGVPVERPRENPP